MPIKHKRTNTSGYNWAPADLAEGQIGLNIADGTLHFKKNNDEIVVVGSGGGGGAADTKTHYGNLFSDPAFKYPLAGSTTPYTLATNERVDIAGTTALPGFVQSQGGSWIAYNWRDIGLERRHTSGCQNSLVVDRIAVPNASNRGRFMAKISNMPLFEGKKVAVSFYAKADTAGSKMAFGVFAEIGAVWSDAVPIMPVVTLSTEWQRFSQVFEVPEVPAEWTEGTYASAYAQFAFTAGPGRYSGALSAESGRVEITGIQVELNDQVSDFYIVPEELYAAAAGANGVGVPAGGSAGQVLSKVDGTDYNTAWTTPVNNSVPWPLSFDNGQNEFVWQMGQSNATPATIGFFTTNFGTLTASSDPGGIPYRSHAATTADTTVGFRTSGNGFGGLGRSGSIDHCCETVFGFRITGTEQVSSSLLVGLTVSAPSTLPAVASNFTGYPICIAKDRGQTTFKFVCGDNLGTVTDTGVTVEHEVFYEFYIRSTPVSVQALLRATNYSTGTVQDVWQTTRTENLPPFSASWRFLALMNTGTVATNTPVFQVNRIKYKKYTVPINTVPWAV